MNPTIRSQFAATETVAYLNSAAVAPPPKAAINAVLSQLEDVSMHGSAGFGAWIETKKRCRALMAEMLGCEMQQVAFLRNTSDGFASIAAGLEWKSGDNIVSFADEFPANFYAWRDVRDRHGVELRLAPERNGRIDLDELVSLIDRNTRVVTISSVQFASGFRSDLARIAEAAQRVDALFCVDLIQGLGAHGYDLPGLGVDVACGASHKWLCAPEGVGYIYLSDHARERISPRLVGWVSVEDAWDFADREQNFKPNALAWESGTGPSALFYGLEQSLKLLLEADLAKVEAHLDELTNYLCEKVLAKNYELVSSRKDGERSAIVCVRHRGGLEPAEIAAHLEKENVIVSPRLDRLRIAPHFFNNVEDIDRLAEALL
ncbi:MAG: class V aminotransferase [Acidobacteria bacterium OLB17]|nr:MAG: class V aminotransferase [Acidobacteria bacterium OLB17]MCZ2390357.1 aminotransferase class V-fold PLP-dependent enzyme [Acidobacteriota bacterium]